MFQNINFFLLQRFFTLVYLFTLDLRRLNNFFFSVIPKNMHKNHTVINLCSFNIYQYFNIRKEVHHIDAWVLNVVYKWIRLHNKYNFFHPPPKEKSIVAKKDVLIIHLHDEWRKLLKKRKEKIFMLYDLIGSSATSSHLHTIEHAFLWMEAIVKE